MTKNVLIRNNVVYNGLEIVAFFMVFRANYRLHLVTGGYKKASIVYSASKFYANSLCVYTPEYRKEVLE